MPLNAGSYATGELASLDYDKEATEQFRIEINKSKLNLQFPPKIISDGKSASWQEDHFFGWEEFARWMGAYARKINIELNYVMWGRWDANKIAAEVRKIKWHLYLAGQSVGDKVPFIYINGWKIIESTGRQAAFRLMNVGIEYSREYVGTGNKQWPLHTKVNLECKLFTQTGSLPTQPKYKQNNFDAGILPSEVKIGWA